ncbi:MarR family winged helix-turn-helix transcriptional regulator [Paenibacillus kobensis]|uniref:MarR family winged helix-turn-helix transcriptional regulator n=1 Tax=Paenibacillus kobensis TaxID=59841 RepID=UPI0013E34E73|nr:MarR family transcriptional regulator [Paenibacillus kobensis]
MPNNSLTIQQLHDAFLLFSKAEWRQRTIRGFNRSEIRVLFSIMESEKAGVPKMKVSDIGKKMMVTTPTITQLMKRLIESELVERTVDPDDKRSVGIELTDKGRQIAMEADEQLNESIDGLIDHLGADDSMKLAELLTKTFHYYYERNREL